MYLSKSANAQMIVECYCRKRCPIEAKPAKNHSDATDYTLNIMQRETERQNVPERVNVCPLMVKPCILGDWLTGSAGAMLESNWVRVCELEERSLNVSHCCRRQTDSEKKQVSQPVQWHHTFTSSAQAATVTRHHQSSAGDNVVKSHQGAWR